MFFVRPILDITHTLESLEPFILRLFRRAYTDYLGPLILPKQLHQLIQLGNIAGSVTHLKCLKNSVDTGQCFYYSYSLYLFHLLVHEILRMPDRHILQFTKDSVATFLIKG